MTSFARMIAVTGTLICILLIAAIFSGAPSNVVQPGKTEHTATDGQHIPDSEMLVHVISLKLNLLY